MTNSLFAAVFIVLAGCTTTAVPASSSTPDAAKPSATSTAPAPDQGPTEAPHRNPKMYGPPGLP
ncbi:MULTISPECIES: hypothetical protein [Burkholderiaceae]|uniref:hypothetical protein n=1 Tax=Burkholderiaceae TaxID=119060 RepID=UPI001177BB4B|nr:MULTISPECIES: hypothetical protein [Burkholderiaceae]